MASGSTAMLMGSSLSPRGPSCGRLSQIAGARMRCDFPLSAAPPHNISVAIEKNATPCFGCS